MAGRINGAQALIAADQPLAIFDHCLIHCLMHCVNLIAADYVEDSTIVPDKMDIASDAGELFQFSTQLNNLMENVNFRAHLHIGLRPLCHTRVLCRGKGTRALLTNLESVCFAALGLL